ncbi:MAG: hypothetical protein RLN89_14650 [Parvibaculum sp.]
MKQHLGRNAVTGLALFTLLGGGQALFGPSLPSFQAIHGLSVPEAGLILTFYWMGGLSAVLLILVPGLAALMRWRAGFASALLALGCFGVSDSGAWPLALAGAALMGAGHGLLTVGLNGFFAASFGARTPVLLNLLNAMFGVGAVGAPILLVSLGGDVEAVFRVLALCFCLLLPVAVMLDDRAGGEVARASAGFASLIRTARTHAFFLVLMGIAVGLEVAIVGWGVTVLSAALMPLDEARTFTSFFYVSFTCARLAAVGLSFRVQPSHFVLGGFLSAVALLIVANSGGTFAGYAFALLGFSIGPLFPNLFAWAAPLIAKEPPLSALVICAGMLGGIAGPTLLSSLGSLLGQGYAFYALAAIALFASVMVTIFLRTGRGQ